MKISLVGKTGGIGSAIYDSLKGHEFVENANQHPDWLIFAQGVIDEEDVGGMFTVNTGLCIKLTQTFLPTLKQGVIYISSTAGIKGNTKFPVYSASKAALNSYVDTMARAHPELQFYALCPGPTDTKMWRSLGLEGEAQDPSEVAKAVKEIMDGKYKSGDVITVRNGKITI